MEHGALDNIVMYSDGTLLYEVPEFSRYLASKDGRIFSKNYGNTGKLKN